MKCRLCKDKLKKFIDLGKNPPPEEFRTKAQLNKPINLYPLNLNFCLSCGHVQLGFKIPADIIYKKNYFYDYSITKTGLKHWKNLTKFIFTKYRLSSKDLVVDIGSNTGTLLSLFKTYKTRILGVDPAKRLVNIARKRGIPTINDYFTPQEAKKIVKNYGQAKIITCTNTFDHVDNLDEFMRGILKLLKKDGLFIIEVPYFKNMIKELTHIAYHHQIDYILLKPLIPFFKKFGLKITDCQQIPMHGGSIRIFVGPSSQKVSKRVTDMLKIEEQLTKDWEKILSSFVSTTLKQKKDLTDLIKKMKKEKRQIAAVGASAKGITLLNYCGLGSESINFITEKSYLKIGRFTPSGIPILPDDQLLKKKPDYALILAWNFTEEIVKNLTEYKKTGGKFIIPVPKLKII